MLGGTNGKFTSSLAYDKSHRFSQADFFRPEKRGADFGTAEGT